MTPALDTSVVLRLLIAEPAHQAAAARQLVAEGTSGKVRSVAVSDLVVGESYFALRHHYDVPHAKAVAALAALLNDRRVFATGVARQVLAASGGVAGPGVMDRLIHGDYDRTGVVLATFDRQAARLPGATLLNA